MSRAGQALMYAAGGVFAVFGALVFITLGLAPYDPTWFLSVLIIMVLYWWIFPLLAILGFIGWYIARGTSRGASLMMAIGGGAFTFAIFFILALTGFWEGLLAAAALLYVPSIITLALGIHSYVAMPVGYGGRITAIYQNISRMRRALRSSSMSIKTDDEGRRRRVLR